MQQTLVVSCMQHALIGGFSMQPAMMAATYSPLTSAKT